MEFNDFLKNKVKIIEEELKKYVQSKKNAQNEIYSAMNYSLMAGGKRLRPIIMLLTAEMCGGNEKNTLPFACALEMIHTYSLIHDDLPAMDNDELRRGKPTNHMVYGEAMAILAGDALLNCAMETALTAELEAEVMVRALRVLFNSSGTEGMIGGQVIDIKNQKLTEEELSTLHLLKTGALIRSAGVVGAITANANEEQINAVDGFCVNLGLAFQIQDDILDVKGNEKELGKPIGSDKDNNKTTYVTLLGMKKSEELVEEYTQKAKKSLEECFGKKADKLIELAEYLINRKI